jgi:hypothetical protein
VLPHELLDVSQGKSASDMDISENSGSGMDQSGSNSNKTAPKGSTPSTDEWNGHVLLRPPIIKATRKFATGATTAKLHKQNILHCMEALLQQPIVSQWEQHSGATILPGEQWDQRQKISEAREMAPQGLALQHEAAGLLAEWEQLGCPTRTG